ncbi:MAG: putative zinc-binding protein [Acidobacteriota bacterium]
MPDLPMKKVGLISCSGEEMPEGTISRLATRRVLETLQPERTVTICLPLFLAGGEGERAFARRYPTIAIDGCAKRCAARGTEMYSGKPAASLVVSDLSPDGSLDLGTAHRLSDRGRELMEATAVATSQLVDRLLGTRRLTELKREAPSPSPTRQVVTCSCGSGIPIKRLAIAGRETEVAALAVIYQSWRKAGKAPEQGISSEMLKTLKIYNSIPASEEEDWKQAIGLDYARFCAENQ